MMVEYSVTVPETATEISRTCRYTLSTAQLFESPGAADMQVQAKNRLLMSKSDLAARRASGSVDSESWIWIIPLRSGEFRVRAFEVLRDLLVDDDDIYDGNTSIVHDETVSSLDDVDDAVIRAGVDPEELDAPWKCEFPL
ncbi:hypothetical protein ABZY45_09220 [Streptomyces sp. NPDC006516]|uniref:hypothetical protein n=1 Tax=Streptomyces sp. NPDC006516 TaxID=3154309 RepID=UPI0033B1738A